MSGSLDPKPTRRIVATKDEWQAIAEAKQGPCRICRRVCGRLPYGAAEGPNPTTRYLCAYCNEPAVLREEGVVVDRFSNVCHENCLEAARRG